jgi:hypothetical protein
MNRIAWALISALAVLAAACPGAKAQGAPTLAVPNIRSGMAEGPMLYDFNTKMATTEKKVTCRVNHDTQSIQFDVTIPLKSGYRPAGQQGRDQDLWGDDRIEVFLQPNGVGPFYQFILNAAGAVYDAKDKDKGWNSTPDCKVSVNGDNWQARIRIPYAQIGFDPAKGDTIKGNVAASSNEPGNQWLLTWAPMEYDFMAVAAFGTFKLVDGQPFVKKFTLGEVKYGDAGAFITADYVIDNPSPSEIVIDGVTIPGGQERAINRKIPLASKKTPIVKIGIGNCLDYTLKIRNEAFPDLELIALDQNKFMISLRNAAEVSAFAERLLLSVDGKQLFECGLGELSKQVIDTTAWTEGNHLFGYKLLKKNGKVFMSLQDTVFSFKPTIPDDDISKLDASRYYPPVSFADGRLKAALSVFDLSSGILPRQITVNGMPVLDQTLRIVFEGLPLPATGEVKVRSSNKNEIKLASVSQAGDKTLTIIATHSYDGFTWYEVSLKSETPFAYGTLEVELPMKLAADIMFNYDSPYYDELFGKTDIKNIGAPTDIRVQGYENKFIGHGRLLKDAESLSLPLCSFVSLATDTDAQYRGLGFCSEGPIGWNLANYDLTYSIVRKNARASLTAHISDGKKRSLVKEIRFSFGIEPYPMRQIRKDFHGDYRIDGSFWPQGWMTEREGNKATLESFAKAGITIESVFENWTTIENYWEVGANKEDIDKYLAAAKAAKLDLLFYFGFLLSNDAPEFPLYHDLLLVKPTGYPKPGHRPYLYYQQGNPDQDSWTVCYASVWGDRFAQGIAEAVRRYGMRGIYCDGTLTPGGCANRKHGCGTVDPYGRLIVTFAVRKHRRLAEMIYASGLKARPDFIIDLHMCMPVPPSMGLVEGYFTGEASALFDPSTRTAPESLRSMFNGALYGVHCDTLRRPEIAVDTIWAQSMLTDSFPRVCAGGGEPHLKPQRLVWGLYDKYRLTTDTFTPYWVKANKVVKDNPNVLVSYYETDQVLIAVVSTYWCDTPQTVSLDFSAFKGLKTNCRDEWTQKNYALDNHKLKLTIPEKNLAFLLIEKKQPAQKSLNQISPNP